MTNMAENPSVAIGDKGKYFIDKTGKSRCHTEAVWHLFFPQQSALAFSCCTIFSSAALMA